MDCSGLCEKWEAAAGLRIQAREGKDIMQLPKGSKWVEPTRPNAVGHKAVLLPALALLRDSPDNKLPYLGNLQGELSDFYTAILGAGVIPDKTIYRNAQEIKRLLGLVKRKAGKKEVTKDW